MNVRLIDHVSLYYRLDEHHPPISALNRLLEVKPGNAVLRHKLRDYCESGDGQADIPAPERLL
jgi:hypothetical protein